MFSWFHFFLFFVFLLFNTENVVEFNNKNKEVQQFKSMDLVDFRIINS